MSTPVEIIATLPSGLYDPSELVLIGSHLEPSPEGRRERPGGAEGDDGDQPRQMSAQDARQTGYLRVRSDFASILALQAFPVMETQGSGTVLESEPTIALIYAYGYEGHNYRLAKPRIMIVSGNGEPYNDRSDGATQPEAQTGKLFMWRLSKHQQTISIELESGALEKLVLEANQPGNRSVSAYSAHMQVAHRGGKLG